MNLFDSFTLFDVVDPDSTDYPVLSEEQCTAFINFVGYKCKQQTKDKLRSYIVDARSMYAINHVLLPYLNKIEWYRIGPSWYCHLLGDFDSIGLYRELHNQKKILKKVKQTIVKFFDIPPID